MSIERKRSSPAYLLVVYVLNTYLNVGRLSIPAIYGGTNGILYRLFLLDGIMSGEYPSIIGLHILFTQSTLTYLPTLGLFHGVNFKINIFYIYTIISIY